MRTREEIEKRLSMNDPVYIEAEIIRLLLDIRDLLQNPPKLEAEEGE